MRRLASFNPEKAVAAARKGISLNHYPEA